jgi:hypothetical protein
MDSSNSRGKSLKRKRKSRQFELGSVLFDIERYEKEIQRLQEMYREVIELPFSDLVKIAPWKYLFDEDPRDKNGDPAPYSKAEIQEEIDEWYFEVMLEVQKELKDFREQLSRLRGDDAITIKSPPKTLFLVPFDPRTGKRIPNESPITLDARDSADSEEDAKIIIGRRTWSDTFGENLNLSRKAVEVTRDSDNHISVTALRDLPPVGYRLSSQNEWIRILDGSSVTLPKNSEVLLLRDVLAFRMSTFK